MWRLKEVPLSVRKARVQGSWGNWYTSLDFQKGKRGLCRRRNWVSCRRGRRRLPYTPGFFYHSRLPGARLPAVTRNSLTLHPEARLARGSGDGGVQTLFNAVCKAAFTLRAPRPAGDSKGSATARRSGASTARARFPIADSDPNHPSLPPLGQER